MRATTDAAFFDYIANLLTNTQRLAIRQLKAGKGNFRDLSPTLKITKDDLREHTNRERIKDAFLEVVCDELESRDLRVLMTDDGVRVTKPYTRRMVKFSSVRKLETYVRQHAQGGK